MIFDYKNKTLQVKIVYYGPAMSGKTTSIKSLFSYFNKEDSVKSIDNSVGRTLFFDFGVLNFKGAEWGLKFLIYSATGQDFYASTRPATLIGVDGLIFVVDSQIEFLEHNLRSWNELKTLFGSEFYNIPIIISLNKCDLFTIQDLTQEEFLSNIDYNKFRHISFKKTVAIRGEGVLDSFSELIKFIFPQLKVNLSIIN
ncbi:MAG: GTPase domain-containing protein [Candidatus Lokiarchaeota archaeon]|nr:GTPase domain-containing protein [Candidatus Lokiarchaeota archaeon]